MKLIETALTYTQIRKIGAGNFGEVYLADDSQLGGEVAIKEIPKSIFKNVFEFFREAQAMFASEHPNVVQIRYASAANDRVCLAMPYYKNGSLGDLLDIGPLPLKTVIHFGQGITSGLTQIHLARQVHLDIKPSNILISDSGEAMVSDFGQARAIGDGGIVVSPLMYNAAKPPEVIQNDHATVETDIYQAGLTIYRALNGNKIWDEQISKHSLNIFKAIVSGEFPDRRYFMPHVPESLRRAVRKSLRRKPSERYGSSSAFGDALGNSHIPIDWHTELHADGGITWRATRKNQCGLVVKLMTSTPSKWSVEFWSDSQGKLRARERDESWKCDCSLSEALNHLTDLFRRQELGQNSRRNTPSA